MIFYIILIIIIIFICIYFYIKKLLDYKYKGTFPTQIKILEIQKLYFSSIIFYIFEYTVYEIRGKEKKDTIIYLLLLKVIENLKNSMRLK